jgi:hypothetical protein
VPNLTNTLLRTRLAEFASYRKNLLTGDEKGEAQIFCDRFFQAFGHDGLREAGATLEFRIAKESNKGTSFADLMWKPRCLIEMKKAGSDLSKHYRQAFDYWIRAVPDRPQFVVLCNFDEFWVYDFDQQLDAPMDRIKIEELGDRWDALSFMLPEPSEPIFAHNLVGVTREAAANVAHVFTALVEAGTDRREAQRFALQCVMAMFAEDIGLLPGAYFTRAVEDCLDHGYDPYDVILSLFREMNTPGNTAGGRFQGTPYFNGGLFSVVPTVKLGRPDLLALRDAAKTNWAFVRPEIFGTLFEQSMDKGERHATGAHFTSQADIMRVVGPCIVDPWRQRIDAAKTISDYEQLLLQMLSFRVLDPACGSGNFLYVAYREMRRLEADILERIDERRTSKDKAAQRSLAYVTPDHFYGMDVNSFAVEVAKVTMMLAKKLSADELDDNQSVLPLDSLEDTIVATDALFTAWPQADVVIGNPPYLGRRKMVAELGADYCARLAERHPNVSGVSDFVCYWVPLAHKHLPADGRAGLVTTNSIKQNESRAVSLDYIVANGGAIFEAVSAKPWSGDAAVTVSIFNWTKGEAPDPKVLWLNEGQLRLETSHISASLSPTTDVATAKAIRANQRPSSCFQGQTPGVIDGFVMDEEQRDALLAKKDGSAFFVAPFLGGDQLLGKIDVDRWVIDLPHADAAEAKFAAPAAFNYAQEKVLPVREAAAEVERVRNEEVIARNPRARPNRHHQGFLAQWWQLGYRRAEMVDALSKLDRYIGTSRYASEKRLTVFTFLDATVRPSDQVTAFALDDDYSMGVLSSQVHRLWLEARCSTLETRLRYTSTTVWDSFPWPQNPDDQQVSRIVAATADILGWREAQLARGVSLKRQYDTLRVPGRNELRRLHEVLDLAVLDAYGFSADEDLLTQLLALNHTVAVMPAEEQRGPGGYGLDGARVTNYRVT